MQPQTSTEMAPRLHRMDRVVGPKARQAKSWSSRLVSAQFLTAGSSGRNPHQEIAASMVQLRTATSCSDVQPKRRWTQKKVFSSTLEPWGLSGLNISHAKTLQSTRVCKPRITTTRLPARMSWAVNWSAGSPSSWRRNHQIHTRETMRSEIIIRVLIWIHVSLQKESARSTFWHHHYVSFHTMPHRHCPNQLPQESWPWIVITFIICHTLRYPHPYTLLTCFLNLSYQPLTDVATLQSLLMVCQCIFQLFSAWLVPCPLSPPKTLKCSAWTNAEVSSINL